MFMAIAVETFRHPEKRHDYRIWYLEIDNFNEVVGIGVKTRSELLESLLENFQRTGQSNWRAFKKESDQSTPVEVIDFISQNMHENTHFGELPTLAEFQETLNHLEYQMELRPIAC